VYCVYLIYNKVNGKRYVGITTNAEKRLQLHLRSAVDDEKPLYRAMRKYGIESFVFDIIFEEIPSEIDALNVEARLIKDYQSLVTERGYNILERSGGRVVVDGMLMCGDCGVEKSVADFNADTSTVAGFSFRCRCCDSRRNRAYHIKNKERISARKREYTLLNQDKIRAYQVRNREKIKAYRDATKERRAAYMKAYRAANAEKIREHNKRYGDEHREELNEYARLYRASKKVS